MWGLQTAVMVAVVPLGAAEQDVIEIAAELLIPVVVNVTGNKAEGMSVVVVVVVIVEVEDVVVVVIAYGMVVSVAVSMVVGVADVVIGGYVSGVGTGIVVLIVVGIGAGTGVGEGTGSGPVEAVVVALVGVEAGVVAWFGVEAGVGTVAVTLVEVVLAGKGTGTPDDGTADISAAVATWMVPLNMFVNEVSMKLSLTVSL
jgi:hypothetical protein